MSFSEALKKLKSGSRIKRSIWGGHWTLEEIDGLDRKIIVATLKETGERVPATAYQEDILAEDWQVAD